jgi:Bacterial type III secretion protein (HrpB4)
VSHPPGTAATLAALACALQARIEDLHRDVDPTWRAPLGLAAEPAAWPDEPLRRRFTAELLARRPDQRPPLTAFDDAAGRLALLERQSLLARLCALALLGRPGVLRSCIHRPARAALQELLGPAFIALRDRAGGTAVPADVAAWAPLAWAWVGYRDLLAAGAWPHRGLRRLARLSLPASRGEAPPASRVPRAATPALQRLAELDDLFDRSPSC